MKAKDINIYRLFSQTYKKTMAHFMDYGEISRMKKVVQVKQTQQKEGSKNDYR